MRFSTFVWEPYKERFSLVLLMFLACCAAAQGIVDVEYNGYSPPATIDIGGSGHADFAVNWSGVFTGTTDMPQSFGTTSWSLSALAGGSFSVSAGQVESLAPGTVIDADSGFWSGGNWAATLSAWLNYPLRNEQEYTGVLAPDASGLVALEFVGQDGGTHYGWMRFRLPTAPADPSDGNLIEFGPQIAEFAWNTTPDQLITAGEVPEPSTWTLLVMASLGILFSLRTRLSSFNRAIGFLTRQRAKAAAARPHALL